MRSLRLFGSAALLHADAPVNVQRHRLALLAVLARAPRLTVSRDRLLALLWPEAPDERARQLLRQALHVLRREVAPTLLVTDGDDVRLNAENLHVDASAFDEAIRAGAWEAAVELYAGPFMDGFHLPNNTEFEEWLQRERSALSSAFGNALEKLALEAETRGDAAGAARWWQRYSAHEPTSGRATLALMHALEHAGDRAGALRAARVHEQLLREEYGTDADPEIAELAAQLARAAPPRAQHTAEIAAIAPDVEPSTTEQDAQTARAVPRTQRRRLQFAALTAAALSAVVISAIVLSGRTPVTTRTDEPAPRVLVAEFETRTGDARFASLGGLAADWISQSLSHSGLVQVVDPLSRYAAGEALDEGAVRDEHARAAALAAAVRADILVTGSFYDGADGIVAHARVVRARDGHVLAAVGPLSATNGVDDLVAELRTRVLGALATTLDERIAALHLTGAPPTYEAYHEYALGLDPFLRHDYAAALPHFRRAAELDTSFLLPVFWSVFTHRNLRQGAQADSLIDVLLARRDRLTPVERHGMDYMQAVRSGDGAAALHSVRNAAALAPGSHWSYLHALSAVSLDRPAEALAALESVAPGRGWLSDWRGYWLVLCDAAHRTGDHVRELDAARRAREADPNDLALLALELRALAALGRTAEVLDGVSALDNAPPERSPGGAVTIALELRAHGHEAAADKVLTRYANAQRRVLDTRSARTAAARFGLAIALARMRQHTQAYRMFDEIAAAEPHSVLAYGWRGVTAAYAGDRTAAHVVADSLARIEMNGLPQLFRARIAAVLGQHDTAAALIHETIVTARAAGPNFPMVWHQEPDVSFLRDSLRLRALQRPLY